MSCNFVTHQSALLESFNKVSNSVTGAEWTIFEYDGTSSIIKVGASGEGGLSELIESFDPSKVQYGFGTAALPGLTQRKVILIHWQGHSIPVTRLASTAGNVGHVKDFVKKVNITVNARSDEDLSLEGVQAEVNKLAPSHTSNPADNSMFEIPAPVGSTYTPVKPHTDIDLQERERFWKEQQQEEDDRRRDEVKKNEERAKLFQMERKMLESKIHETHLSNVATKVPTPATPPPSTPTGAQKKSALISGRTQMFEQKVQELIQSSPKPCTKPKNFKYEVAVSKPLGTPVNRENGVVAENNNVVKSASSNEQIDAPSGQSLAEIKRQFAGGAPPLPTSSPPATLKPASPVTEETNGHTATSPSAPPPLPLSPPPASNRVIALWDYQAREGNEISFDPEDVITDVERIHEGWWKGRAPNGQVGLFPSNFVKPI